MKMQTCKARANSGKPEPGMQVMPAVMFQKYSRVIYGKEEDIDNRL
jgi:hypothetical protein